jgi:dipeptidyl-peptidase-4
LHTAFFGHSSTVYVHVVHTLEALPRAFVVGAGAPRELPSLAEEPPLRPRVAIEQVGPRALRAEIVRPRDFDPKRRYPVVVDVYGGPHHLHVTRALGPALIRQWVADQGFVVVSADGRGTPRRGRAWERAIHGDFSTVTVEDQVAALDALGALHPELDLSRVGVFGWSFGGYMAALCVLERPDRFRGGVAGAPVIDWRDYDTHYTERYLGVPDRDAAPYDKSSLLPRAPKLERPLLLVHGTSDDNVYFLHTLKMADALFRAGRPFDLLPLAGLTHMVPDPLVKERLYQRIVAALAAATSPSR